MLNTNRFFLLASVTVFSSAEILDVCSDSCVQQDCVGKMFILTPAKATFDKARGMCLALGGDIVQQVLSENGKKYHSGLGDIFVGATDTYEESKWRYLSSGKEFDASPSPFSWHTSQPNGGTDANCLVTNGVNYYDVGCSFLYYGLCEIESSLC